MIWGKVKIKKLPTHYFNCPDCSTKNKLTNITNRIERCYKCRRDYEISDDGVETPELRDMSYLRDRMPKKHE